MSTKIHETWKQSGHWRAAHAFLYLPSQENGRKEWLGVKQSTTKSKSTQKCTHYNNPFTHGKLFKEKLTGKNYISRPKIINPLKKRPWLKYKCSVVFGMVWHFSSNGFQNHCVSSTRGHYNKHSLSGPKQRMLRVHWAANLYPYTDRKSTQNWNTVNPTHSYQKTLSLNLRHTNFSTPE